MATLDEPLHLPARVPEPRPPGFPVLACIAPLVAAAVFWLITQSTFALLFAVLSPVIAVASLYDGRRATRRQRAVNLAERAAALSVLRDAVRECHDLLREEAWRRQPGGTSVLAECGTAALWRPGGDARISLGVGRIPSGLRLGGAAGPTDERELRDWAGELSDAPVTADASAGIGLVGPAMLTRALARSLLVQLCFTLPPGRCGVAVGPAAAWDWARALPHVVAALTPTRAAGPARLPGEEPCQVIVTERATAGRGAAGPVQEPFPRSAAPYGALRVVLALAETETELPPGCATVVRVQGPVQAQIVRSPDHRAGLDFRPELVAAEQAHPFARLLSERAAAAGLHGALGDLPLVVAFGTLVQSAGPPAEHPPGESVTALTERAPTPAGAGGNATLDCVIGVGEHGPVRIDLVRQGPHAVVGGTTGSGKSELLVTWVVAMATTGSVRDVNFLLVDFKGGAAFAPLLGLPHCVGMITDLDALAAERALASLGAELRFREDALRKAGVRDLVQAPDLGIPRLVIVVDEFATMLQTFPDLHALFVDIAARGRSLGVHLILCTQRPAGVVRDSLLANCSLRVSLRVNNRADSEAVIGSDAAAALPLSVPGRCLITAGEGEPDLCQVATIEQADILALSARVTPAPVARRPWLAPLPALLTGPDLRQGIDVGIVDADSLVFGLVDEPERQRYRVARYHPEGDGHLLVVGDARTGKSTLLDTLAAQVRPGTARRAAPDPEALWDVLETAVQLLDARTGQAPDRPLLVLIDDLDAVIARWGPEHQLAALDLLTILMRDGPAARMTTVITVQRLTGMIRGLAALCPNRLLLGLRDRDDYRAAGGPAALFSAHPVPGSGCWDGSRVQLLAPTAGTGTAPGRHGAPASPPTGDGSAPFADLASLAGQGPVIVVSASRRTLSRIHAALNDPAAVVQLTPSPVTPPTEPSLRVGGPAGTVFVGDVDCWQAQWALLALLRPHATFIFDACSLADYRLISRRRELPPPLLAGQLRVWVLTPDGRVRRARLS
ncbi:MAG: FtsK/SpoIIIE domain-containing protein [Cryobacterium sp.]